MTNEYKENLLNYLTNNIDSQTGVNEPQFSDYITTDNNIYKQIEESLGTLSFVLNGFINPSNEGNFLIYGRPIEEQTSFISIFNSKMELITTLTQFDSGSDIMRIYCMKQDDDGYIYALSQMVEEETTVVRVLLLNNILASGLTTGTYSVTIRKSYICPISGFHIMTVVPSRDLIVKAPDEATYYITGRNDNADTQVLRFKIDVSSGNTWDTYTITDVWASMAKFSVLLNKTDNGYDYYLYSFDIKNDNYVEYKIDYEGTITNLKTISVTHPSFNDSMVLAINSENIYLAVQNYSTEIQSLYKVNGNSLQLFEQTPSYIDEESRVYSSIYNLQNINGNVFFTKYAPSSTGIDIYIAIMINDTIYYSEETNTIRYNLSDYNTTIAYNDTFINNVYNLYNIYTGSTNNEGVTGNYNNKTQLVYNSSNYNGLSFNDKNSLNPSTAQLFNDSSEVIFARNLYNKIVQANTTESTVEVPNTYLNDQNIASQELLSVNNNIMVDNNNTITKNIYETLYINFFNTIRIMNNNDTSAPVLNPTGATRLNNSISNLIDYTDATLTKARINYMDGTSSVIAVTINTITNARQIQLTIEVEKEITNIEFISNDENTVYNTITGNFEIGKTYNILQPVTVDGVIISVDNLQYNGEDIQYNGEDIMVVS